MGTRPGGEVGGLSRPPRPRALALSRVLDAPWLRIVAPFAYMGFIFALSSIPGTEPAPDDLAGRVFNWLPPDLQNVLHVPLYAGLTWLWVRALARRAPVATGVLVASALLSLGYGLADEWHQSFVPGRYGSGTDAALNAVGAVLAAIALHHRDRLRAGRPS